MQFDRACNFSLVILHLFVVYLLLPIYLYKTILIYFTRCHCLPSEKILTLQQERSREEE